MRRWTASEFWEERGDVLPTRFMVTNDALRIAFEAGAREAQVLHGHPVLGDATVRVGGLRRRARRQLEKTLNDDATRPLTTRIRVRRLTRRNP